MAYDRLYQRLETKEGEKEVFKLARAKERRTRDLGVVRCIKDENGKVLFENAEIKERWQRYFSNLLNGEGMEDSRSRNESVVREELICVSVVISARTRLKRL